jgi:DNA-binding FadR family transcriptional regulator
VKVTAAPRARSTERHRPPVEFGRIHPLRAHEYVAEQLRRHIALRLVTPGEALPPERELATMFGVGRFTVQHALRLLEADRLVEARRGRRGGTFVLAPADDPQAMDELTARLLRRRAEIEQLLDYRLLLEPKIAELAAASSRKPKRPLELMERALAGMATAASDADYMRLDTEFHLAIAAATQNRYLEDATERIRLELNDALSLLPESEVWLRRLSAEHEAIFEAVAAGDADAASRAAELHVRSSDTGVRAVLTAIRRRRGRKAA